LANARKQAEEEIRRKIKKEEVALKKKELRDLQRQLQEEDLEEKERRENERKGAYLLADATDSDDEDDEDGEAAEAALQEKLKKIKEGKKKYPTGEDDDEDDVEDYAESVRCEVCNKDFKTVAQLTQHNASKIHRKMVQEEEKKTKGNKGGGGVKSPTKVSAVGTESASQATEQKEPSVKKGKGNKKKEEDNDSSVDSETGLTDKQKSSSQKSKSILFVPRGKKGGVTVPLEDKNKKKKKRTLKIGEVEDNVNSDSDEESLDLPNLGVQKESGDHSDGGSETQSDDGGVGVIGVFTKLDLSVDKDMEVEGVKKRGKKTKQKNPR
jgi:DnaJ family protein A protein 5